MGNTKMYWLHALTPLHVGSGRGVGFIDLPIAREKVTRWPLVPGSAVKGVVADHHGATDDARGKDPNLKAAFGTASEDQSNAGAIVFTDARLVCLPVRSFFGTFAWVTSPFALRRLMRDLEPAGMAKDLKIPSVTVSNKALVPPGSVLKDAGGKAYLEDLDFGVVDHPAETKDWAEKIASWVFAGDKEWQEVFMQRFAVIPDGSFDFFTETGMEVTARVRIKDETKTVDEGALWYEEALPAESILAGLLWCDRVFGGNAIKGDELLRKYCGGNLPLQVGGKATVGRGRVRCVFPQGG